MNKNDYSYLSGGAEPDPSTLSGVLAGILAFLAFGMAASLNGSTDSGTGLVVAIGAGIAAAAFALVAVRTSRVEEKGLSLTPTNIARTLPRSPKALDKAA